MKSFFLIMGALLMVSLFRVESAAALSIDHGSDIANTDGTSRFSDPDEQQNGNQFGSMQFGNASRDNAGGGGATFGFFSTGEQTNSIPGLYPQNCVSGVDCPKQK
jgi:hypothetical protein